MKRSTKRKILAANPFIFAAGMALMVIGNSIDQILVGIIGALLVSWPIIFMLSTYSER